MCLKNLWVQKKLQVGDKAAPEVVRQEVATGMFEELRQGKGSTFLLPVALLWVTAPTGLAEGHLPCLFGCG